MDSNGRCDRGCYVSQWINEVGDFVRLPLRGLPCDAFCHTMSEIAKDLEPGEDIEAALERWKKKHQRNPWEES